MRLGRSFPRVVAALLSAGLAACIQGEASTPPEVPGGVPEQGRQLIFGYACGGCHIIPGVPGANGLEGPPLTDWVERQYIAGAVWNTPENLILFIMSPQEIEPGTAMPDMGVSAEQARHMAAYLYTLGDTDPWGPPHPFPVEWLHSLKTGGKKKEPVGYRPAPESGLPDTARTPTVEETGSP